jgi:hypothetical protein
MNPRTDRAVYLLAGLALVAAALAASPTTAAEPAPDGSAFFEKNIRPVLVERCYGCHSAGAPKLRGELWLDSRAGVLRGGAGGPVIVPGQPDKSRLVRALRYSDPDLRMPPKGPLAPQQVAAFETWVRLGAPDPRETTPAPNRSTQTTRTFWSFQPLRDPPLPRVRDTRWPANAVDYFVLAGLEGRGLHPGPAADKQTLIRRATFDLTGLPPRPEEVDAFLADESAEAFERVIDRLLASPHYGERWGRHWLDLVRYADTSGCNSDFPVPSAYRYRNYVLDAFNRDKPYYQFVREQVAGDLLPARDEAQKREQTIATAYLAIARRFGSLADEFHLTLEDAIDNLGKVVLGLSVSCARCHDHKFDPIQTADYYALYGILESTRFAFPGTEIYRHSKDFVALAPPDRAEALRKYEAELARLDARLWKLIAEKASVENRLRYGTGTPPGGRTLEQVKAEMEDVKGRIRILEAQPVQVEKAYAVVEGTPHAARIHQKGDPKHPGAVVPRGFLQALGGRELPVSTKGSGRLELARWLTDRHNPLTARVMVNRIWQYHFGKGIVPTPNDFGTRGKPPTHPELLDYLASRFVAGGWSVKAMHRLLMLSRTYQLGSSDDAHNAALDVNNDYRWRFDRRRLSAEEIRDAMLAASGALDPTVGGPHPFPPETGYQYTQHKPFVAVYDTNRRSVYLMQQRLKRHPLLEVFDGADPNVTTPDRPLSTTALQALFLMNDPFVHDQADRLAVRVGMAFGDEPDRIDYAYRLALGRHATSEEVLAGQSYLRECRQRLKEAGLPWDRQPRAALASYARVLLSSNEFLFVD